MTRAKSLQNSWEKLNRSNRLLTAELQKLWKNATFWPFAPAWGNWPICNLCSVKIHTHTRYKYVIFSVRFKTKTQLICLDLVDTLPSQCWSRQKDWYALAAAPLLLELGVLLLEVHDLALALLPLLLLACKRPLDRRPAWQEARPWRRCRWSPVGGSRFLIVVSRRQKWEPTYNTCHFFQLSKLRGNYSILSMKKRAKGTDFERFGSFLWTLWAI